MLMVCSITLAAEVSAIMSAYSRLLSVAVLLDRSESIWRSTLLIISLLMEASASLTRGVFPTVTAWSGLISAAVWLDLSSSMAA